MLARLAEKAGEVFPDGNEIGWTERGGCVGVVALGGVVTERPDRGIEFL